VVKMILFKNLDMLFCGMQYSIGSIACFQQDMPTYYFGLLISYRLILDRLEQRREMGA